METTKEAFYSKLMNEKEDIIIKDKPNGTGNFYPSISEFVYRYKHQTFGKIISLGYVNGIYTQEFYLSGASWAQSAKHIKYQP